MSPRPGRRRCLAALAALFASAAIALLGAGGEDRPGPDAGEAALEAMPGVTATSGSAGELPCRAAVVTDAVTDVLAAIDRPFVGAAAAASGGGPAPDTPALTAVLARIDGGDDHHERVRDLRDAIRLAPPDPAGLAALLGGPWRTGTTAQRLAQALQLDGAPASVAALRTAAGDPTLPPALRRRVLRALGDVPGEPSPSLDLLWNVANDPATEPGIARAAMLAFGRAAAGLRTSFPEQHATAVARLDDALRTVRNRPLASAARSALRTARP